MCGETLLLFLAVNVAGLYAGSDTVVWWPFWELKKFLTEYELKKWDLYLRLHVEIRTDGQTDRRTDR